MLARILLIASAACVFNLANGLSEPFPGFHPCKMSDAECILDNAIKGVEPFVSGIPALKVKPLDPITFTKIDASSPNLKFILHDIVLTGLKTCKPLEAKRDVNKSQMTFLIQCDLKLEGHYEMNGQLLVFKFAGDGKADVLLSKMLSKVIINFFMKEGKDGKKYLRVKNFEHSYELKEKSHVSFEGLFQDSDVLGKAADDFIKNNSNEIIQEIGGPVFKVGMTEIVENINRFFAELPIQEITLDSA